jgi:hypothetical protein
MLGFNGLKLDPCKLEYKWKQLCAAAALSKELFLNFQSIAGLLQSHTRENGLLNESIVIEKILNCRGSNPSSSLLCYFCNSCIVRTDVSQIQWDLSVFWFFDKSLE